MARASQDEISMRHFADLSDASFQIPRAQDDDILTEDRLGGLELNFAAFDDGEMGGLDDDPFTTPIPRSKKHAPLTLSEITPRGERADARAPGQKESTVNARMGKGKGKGKETAKDKHKQPSVRPVLPKKESVDDMFQRRKRDNYQQMGIDLTSKSTARLRHDKVQAAETKEVRGETRISVEEHRAAKVVARPHGYAESQAKGNNKGKTKRPAPLTKDAGITKHKPQAPSSAAARPTRPKSILKPVKSAAPLPPSTLSRTLTAMSHTPKVERPKWRDVVAEIEQTSHGKESSGSGMGPVGGGLIDVLVMYGEKLKGSLGFSSSSGKASTSQDSSSHDTRAQSTGDRHHTTHNSTKGISHLAADAAGRSSKPLTLSDLSPSKFEGRRRKDELTLSDLSPSKQSEPEADEESHGNEQSYPETSPMRPSRKRTSPETPSRERKKGRLGLKPESQPPVSRLSSKTTSERGTRVRGHPAVKASSKPKPLGPSHIANGVYSPPSHPRPRIHPASAAEGTAPTKPRLGPVASTRDLKGKANEVTAAATYNRRAVDKEHRAPTPLTIPTGPMFASDVYRQRALEKTQTEREKKEEQQKQKRAFKAGAMPYFSKPAPPARPAIRPTVPATFTFHSDARAAQRNAEFEEKRKTWESRATHHALPMPDFAAMHAAEAEAVRGRRVVPVLPTDAPPLTTMVRAKEREKFDEERRERERATETLREMRERERAEQEDRAYREARKRTVPKAHEVPDWYKDVPKRKEVD